jgi:hypothetical protein
VWLCRLSFGLLNEPICTCALTDAPKVVQSSSLLVGSYVHLRIEGLEGYIADFNEMVKTVHGVVGNRDIEILPVVPVVREGMDLVGRELVAMVLEWVDWIGVMSGRESVRKLRAQVGKELMRMSGRQLSSESPAFR